MSTERNREDQNEREIPNEYSEQRHGTPDPGPMGKV